ncbi:MAG TPA: C-type lectin domain-containing protein [Polyangiaceae bacterium]|nr:C-type lectin domain-containing protein [Polyangiaceae bacterium]
MPRFVAKEANNRGTRVVDLRALASAALMAALLPGCPLSDKYYVDATATGGHTAASGGETTMRGGAGFGPSGGNAALGGGGLGAGAAGGAGGTKAGGSGGDAANGGDAATGGSATTGGTGGANGGGGSGGTSGAAAEGGADAKGGTGGGAGSTDCSDEPERCDGIDNNCNDEIDEGAACPDGCSVEINDSHRYLICVAATKAEGWDTDGAAARCSELAQELDLGVSFELAWIESKAENEFLRAWLQDNLSGSAVVWTGASDRYEENVWVWGTGTNAVQFFVGDADGGGTPYMNRFNDWASGSPRSLNGEDQDCGAFDTGLSLHWDDRACDSVERGFICEEG